MVNTDWPSPYPRDMNNEDRWRSKVGYGLQYIVGAWPKPSSYLLIGFNWVSRCNMWELGLTLSRSLGRSFTLSSDNNLDDCNYFPTLSLVSRFVFTTYRILLELLIFSFDPIRAEIIEKKEFFESPKGLDSNVSLGSRIPFLLSFSNFVSSFLKEEERKHLCQGEEKS